MPFLSPSGLSKLPANHRQLYADRYAAKAIAAAQRAA